MKIAHTTIPHLRIVLDLGEDAFDHTFEHVTYKNRVRVVEQRTIKVTTISASIDLEWAHTGHLGVKLSGLVYRKDGSVGSRADYVYADQDLIPPLAQSLIQEEWRTAVARIGSWSNALIGERADYARDRYER